MSALMLLILACGGPAPTVDGVTPTEGPPGAQVKVLGANFDPAATATLGGAPLTSLTVRGPVLIEANVPDGLSAGPLDLVVTNPDGQSVSLAGAYTVKLAEALVPCGGGYTAFSAVATDSGTVKIDKHYKEPKGKIEQVSVPIADLDAIEYSATAQPDGRVCSAIVLRTKAGERHLFDDDLDSSLKDRAAELAQGLGKKLDVGQEDTPTAVEDPG
ncbi:MAG: IPT/TIG domain-containing protein [Deltaproteobacteria bacterium]|nr:IPT/TIG domain-containing protein [Deltaproteobacteria bacterium]MBK9366675.1 IPT/TIG domain-containing protein [Deltaproteobacteria bacterium]